MAGNELEERLRAFVRAFGLHEPDRTPCGQPLSVSEAQALSDIACHEPLSAGELAKRLQLEKSTVSRIIAQLQRRRWIERMVSPEDRRVALLTLTAAGRAAESALAEARHRRFSSLLERIPAHERLSVLRSLDLLVDALQGEPDGRPAQHEWSP